MPQRSIKSFATDRYLQIGTQCGFMVLLLVLAVFVLTIRCGWHYSQNCCDREKKRIYEGMTMAVTAYVLMGVFYDSCLCVTPLCCLLVGILNSKKVEI